MKKIIVVVLVLAMCVSMVPSVHASDMSENVDHFIGYNSGYALYNYCDDTMLYNIVLEVASKKGSFAIKFAKNPAYMYEYMFEVDNVGNIYNELFWEDIIEQCFSDSALWRQVYISQAVVDNTDVGADAPIYSVNGTTSDMIADVRAIHGAEYTGRFIRSGTYEGLHMDQYQSMSYSVYLKSSHLVTTAISIAGLLTSIFGLIAGGGLLAVLGAITGVAGVVYPGTRVSLYNVS